MGGDTFERLRRRRSPAHVERPVPVTGVRRPAVDSEETRPAAANTSRTYPHGISFAADSHRTGRVHRRRHPLAVAACSTRQRRTRITDNRFVCSLFHPRVSKFFFSTSVHIFVCSLHVKHHRRRHHVIRRLDAAGVFRGHRCR